MQINEYTAFKQVEMFNQELESSRKIQGFNEMRVADQTIKNSFKGLLSFISSNKKQ